MKINKIFVCLFIVILMAFPALANDATINRWVLDITLNEDGIVDELIQTDIGNTGTVPIDGFSFEVPASHVTVLYDFDHTFSSKGQVVEQAKVQNGTKLTVNFNSSLNSGETWGGRIGFKAENFAKKSGNNYTIEIPLNVPQAITSGKSWDMKISPDVDLRCQIFLPKGIEAISTTPKPFRVLFQNSFVVPTWTSVNIHFTDTINIKGSFSDVLKKIADVNERSNVLSKRIKEANIKGLNTVESQTHLKNSENLSMNNLNSAWAHFLTKDDGTALELIGRAENELNMAENSLPSSGETNVEPKTEQKIEPNTTDTVAVTPKKSPGPDIACLIFIVLGSFMVLRKKRNE
jgi:hypothetical protein